MTEILTPLKSQTMTEILTPSKSQTMTEILTPSKSQTMTEILTPSKSQTMTELLTPSKSQTMSEILTLSKSQTMTEILTSSKSQTMTEILTSSKSQTMTEILTISKSQPVVLSKKVAETMFQNIYAVCPLFCQYQSGCFDSAFIVLKKLESISILALEMFAAKSSVKIQKQQKLHQISKPIIGFVNKSQLGRSSAAGHPLNIAVKRY